MLATGCGAGQKIKYVDRPVPVDAPCLEESELPPSPREQRALKFYYCLKEWKPQTQKLVADESVVCISDKDFRELILRVETHQDFVEDVRIRCVAE